MLSRDRNVRGPPVERGSLVVDEESAVFHRRWPLGVPSGQHEQFFVLPRGHIVPPAPGRYPDSRGDIVTRVDRSALVASRENEHAFHPGERILHDLFQGYFPFSGDAVHIDFAVLDQSVHQTTPSDRSDQHRVTALSDRVLDPRFHTGHRTQVLPQVIHHADDTFVVVSVDDQGRDFSPRGQRKATANSVIHDVVGTARGLRTGTCRGSRGQHSHPGGGRARGPQKSTTIVFGHGWILQKNRRETRFPDPATRSPTREFTEPPGRVPPNETSRPLPKWN